MKPYYSDKHATIYHGDCLDVMASVELPELSAVVMDPPYSSGTRTEASKSSSGAMLRGARFSAPIENDQMTTPGFIWLMREVALSVRDRLSPGGALLSFIDWRQWPNLIGALESRNLRVNGMVVWDKGSMGLGNGFRAQHELICFASNGTPRITARDCGNVLRFPRVEPVDHPSPKPVPLCERLLTVVTDAGGLVLDPFMGSGTTLVAAKNLGRKSIGIETEERYCEIAAKRLSQEVLDFGASDEVAA